MSFASTVPAQSLQSLIRGGERKRGSAEHVLQAIAPVPVNWERVVDDAIASRSMLKFGFVDERSDALMGLTR